MATDYEIRALVRGQPRATDQCLAKLGSFWPAGQLASLVRVRGGYHAILGSGMRASTPRQGAFLHRVSRATGTAEEKRLHAVN